MNLAVLFSQLILPPNNFSNKFLGLSYLSMIIWLLVALPAARIPIRVPVPIAFLIGLQVWTFICAIAAQFSAAQMLAVSLLTGFYLLYVLVFLQSAALCWLFPESRRYVMNMFVGLICISTFVAYLQFIKFGPAIELSRQYNPMPIDNWGNRGGLRAFGLYGQLHHQAIACLTCATLISGSLLTRSLKRWEMVLVLYLLGGALIAQSRILYVSVVVFLGLFAYLYYRRERQRAIPLLFALGLGIVGFIFVFRDQFAYLLSTGALKDDASLVFRQEMAWVQASRIFDALPWTGIGPTGFLATGTGGVQFMSKFTTGANLDNGYLLILSFSGLPGLVLWLGFLLTTFVATLRQVFWDPIASPEQRTFAIAVFMNVTGISLTMFMGNVIPNAPPNFAVCMLAGLAMATFSEQQKIASRPFARLFPRP
jgi:O-antigen ligase